MMPSMSTCQQNDGALGRGVPSVDDQPRVTVLERWILAAILPAGGQVFAFAWVVFLVATFGLADPGFTPLHEWTV